MGRRAFRAQSYRAGMDGMNASAWTAAERICSARAEYALLFLSKKENGDRTRHRNPIWYSFFIYGSMPLPISPQSLAFTSPMYSQLMGGCVVASWEAALHRLTDVGLRCAASTRPAHAVTPHCGCFRVQSYPRPCVVKQEERKAGPPACHCPGSEGRRTKYCLAGTLNRVSLHR